MVIQATPGTTVRVTPRDAATLALGEAAAGAAVAFAPAMGEPVTAEADEAGQVAVPTFQPPELVSVTWDEGGVECVAAVEVVQSHYCSLADVLGHGAEGDTPEDHGADEAAAWEARAWATEVVERNARRRFVPTIVVQDAMPTGRVEPLDWPDATALTWEPDGAMAVPVGDSAVVVAAPRQPMPAPVRLTYRAGLASVPAAIRAATAALAASRLVPSRIPDRATGESTDAGMLHFTLAGIDGATGIPDVDAAIEQWGRRRAAVL